MRDIDAVSLRCDAVTYVARQGTESLTVLQHASAEWQTGISTALLGASGSGKSTLLGLLAGFQRPTSGAIYYGDTQLTGASEATWAWMRNTVIGYVFQAPLLIPELSVIENVMLRGLIAEEDRARLEAEAYLLLREVGLQEKALRSPLLLSGGEQQRIAVLRAIFGKPRFLLLDEPTAHLDVVAAGKLLELLHHIQHTRDVGMIIATHDRAIAQRMNELWELRHGVLQRG